MILHTAESSGERTHGSLPGVVKDLTRTLTLKSAGVFTSTADDGREYYFYPMP